MDMIYTLGEIDDVAQSLMKKFASKSVWAFHAPMGAGKTTLVTALCKILGVQDRVNSPTFAIMNEYQGLGKVIYHMDWYRLKSEEEAIQAGVEDALDSGNLCLVEWPEKAEGLLPDNCFELHMEVLDQKMRRLYTENE